MENKLIEDLINTLVDNGYTPSQVAVAVHNALAYGELHKRADMSISDKKLSKIMKAATRLTKTLRKAED